MNVFVFYRFETINSSAMMESFVQKYFTKLSQFGSTGTFWDTHFLKYVIKATYSVENSVCHDTARKLYRMNAKKSHLFFHNVVG